MTSRILTTLFVPAATVIVEAKKSSEPPQECVCRPSELPLYSPKPTPAQRHKQSDIPQTEFEQNVGKVRQQVLALTSEGQKYYNMAKLYVERGIKDTEGAIKYLAEEENTTPKYGAIAIGGLAGFIFGLRGGLFRRTLYGTVGALGMASICYPKETTKYYQLSVLEAKRYAVIAYNFAYGVKKDDQPLELPSLPTSFDEVWSKVKGFAQSSPASETVTSQEKVNSPK